MKVLLLNDSLAAGGAQRQFVGLAILLKRAGYDVVISTYHDLNFFGEDLKNNRVAFELIPGAADKKRRIYRVCKYLKGKRPDCVIAFQEAPSIIACIGKLLGLNYRLIVSERRTRNIDSFWTKIVYWLFQQADFVVPNSHSQEKWILSHQPKISLKVKTITNFVDLNKFSYVEKSKSLVPRIIVAATVSEVKNVYRFLDAIYLLKKKNVSFHIDWYGLNPVATEYQQKCIKKHEELDLQDVFTFLPKSKSIEEEYRKADFFCLPSLSEGCSNAICEAISTGLPVVCSSVGDNPYLVKDKYNGYLFNPLCVEDIVEKIECILKVSSDVYNQYRINSRKHAEFLLGETQFVEAYKSIIHDTK